MMGDRDGEVLRRIESKLAALLALQLDQYLRTSGTKARERSLDRLFADAGLTRGEIGALLGKTERAVNLQLQRERDRAKKKTTSRSEDNA